MIELSPLARPYAKAVFSAALDAGTQTEVAEQLKLLSVVSVKDKLLSPRKTEEAVFFAE